MKHFTPMKHHLAGFFIPLLLLFLCITCVNQAEKPSTDSHLYNRERKIRIDGKYLNIPVKQGSPKRLMSFRTNGKRIREFVVELAEAEPDYWMFLDVSEWLGEKITVSIDTMSRESQGLNNIFTDTTVRGFENLYHEIHRPGFHFTSRRGWHNDPNGLVYYKGTYHMFYQHNPLGWPWGNMTWGHAVSADLVHWSEMSPALYPDSLGTIFSGSAVVDWQNATGLQKGKEETLVAFYTAAGGTSEWSNKKPFTQCMAYSNDRGHTWTKYADNPVLPHILGQNRDPKVAWYDSGQLWVMALYLDKNEYALFTSKDMKSWKEIQRISLEGVSECPDFFEIALDGDPAKKKWVLTGANGRFLAGSFNGKEFKSETKSCSSDWGKNYYAVQTFSDIEDGRRIQIGWMAGSDFLGMPFNQQMSFPRELTLRSTPEGIRLYALPVREIEKLHADRKSWVDTLVKPGSGLLEALRGELYHIVAEFNIDNKSPKEFGFNLKGFDVRYNTRARMIKAFRPTDNVHSEVKVIPNQGKLKMEIIIDRVSVEIFINNGEVPMAFFYIPDDRYKKISLFSDGGELFLNSLDVYELNPIWK